jgi:EamA domain-containing membrane protein RarD
MSLFVEDSIWVFLFLTVILAGAAAFQAGRAMASKWRPVWLTIVYMVLLGLAVRFFHFALFEGDLLSLHYFITDTLVLIAAAMLGYRLTRVKQMTTQYPWLYERSGPFSWRERAAG